ncbi:MAG TPA: c-type cytochrome domain-containing protein [Isosphaeraceae bacterium]|nr:c-type cytochrome domain-containing protein [Isosphaeraceae bacterium]
MAEHCYAYHGASKQKEGLRLDRKPVAFRGGDSGPVIVPGKANDSLVVRLTAGLEEDRVMPPKGERLASQQVAALRAWIDQGAEWPGT